MDLFLIGKFALIFVAVQLALVWILLPFALYGIKGRMDAAAKRQEDMARDLLMLRRSLEAIQRIAPDAARALKRMAPMGETTATATTDRPVAEALSKDADVPTSTDATEKIIPVPEATEAIELVATAEDKIASPEPVVEAVKDTDPQADVEEIVVKEEPRSSLVTKKKKRGKSPETSQTDTAFGTLDGIPETDVGDLAEAMEALDEENTENGTIDFTPESASEIADLSNESYDEADLETDQPAEEVASAEDEELTKKLSSITLGKSLRAKDKTAPDSDITEDDSGQFMYRGRKYPQLVDAMRQQQLDAALQ